MLFGLPVCPPSFPESVVVDPPAERVLEGEERLGRSQVDAVGEVHDVGRLEVRQLVLVALGGAADLVVDLGRLQGADLGGTAGRRK